MKVYVSGPMRGKPLWNFPAFFEAEELMGVLGHTTFNPARVDMEAKGLVGQPTLDQIQDFYDSAQGTFDIRKSLSMDLEWICGHGEAIFLLPGWEKSPGATSEFATAAAIGQQAFMFVGPRIQQYEARWLFDRRAGVGVL